MITKGGSRQARRFFARHLMNAKDNERVRLVGVHGFAHEDVNAAWRDLEAFAKDRPNCKNFFFAISLNPERGEELTEGQWKEAEEIALRGYGAEGQPYISYEHVKNGRKHRHLVISRINMETGKVISDAFTYRKNEAISREIERVFGLNVTPSVLVKDRGTPRPKRRPKDYEVFRGKESGLEAERMKREATVCWHGTETGAELRQALLKSGYILCRGDRRDFVLVDPARDEHSLPRCIAGVKAAEVRERMRDIDAATLPSVPAGRAMANSWSDNDAARAVLDKHVSEVLSREREPEPVKKWRQSQLALLRQAEIAAAYERSRLVVVKAQRKSPPTQEAASWAALTGMRPRPSGAANWRELVARTRGELELER